MSIMHTLISSRAMALAALYEDCPPWPADTTFADRDISIGAQSLSTLAAQRGTPCLLIAPSNASARGEDYRSVVITAILARTPRRGLRHPMELTVDCDLSALDSRVLDVLPVQCPNARRRKTTLLRSPHTQTAIRVLLPQTCAPGDLLALTCDGTITLGQITSHPTRIHPGSDGEQWQGRCLK
ncbi:MAG: hypothetical protein U1E32_02370 [Rhodoglobus sp.]|uniref:hypothetical protein n=1 Tax=Actinomycetes TaxID=1760 RepID=UPI00076AF9D0|nr:hypothetical protein [Microbacterium sp. PAMC 28756]AMG82296.1 hypothetical protein AXH82_02080 [Microbacterium sp. PAMC 28756]MDZ4044609.1 hypothetical protein [Rhodoglobus sp.]